MNLSQTPCGSGSAAQETGAIRARSRCAIRASSAWDDGVRAVRTNQQPRMGGALTQVVRDMPEVVEVYRRAGDGHAARGRRRHRRLRPIYKS
ncbi:hypothetical protein C7S16_4144 [Burkholderia thailandensis]|uniref:Uncharacterized protein n=1 Tax=Burkholderia thailandensis TaxID=57975 RepID=A0AAW9D5U9_BURTH|nr:hypothetical protein [Burkholderia thailandensis]